MRPRYLLDTNICIYIVKHQPARVKARFDRLRPGRVVISVITFAELTYGANKSQQRERVQAMLTSFVELIPILPLDRQAAEKYGQIRADLEKRGISIGNNDLWIGAHAVSEKLVLVTNNEREFGRIDQLKIENWAV
jgi:tRNA(fMet)-specific endonuclease VapC